ncbi:MAG TPA: GTPase ObgE [Syntrophales bacterium]|nr:GTPase ObgE [Syntrophales bacterium]HON99839.1 GTPase ObgE [Syntrophales bacterium]HPC01444.1 GTPase ObgE [Syntrophales bacterium]HRS87457.1 GTPase ObgE [Syntrophales bacterium]
MRFIDEARVWVKAGDGGRGCVSFRRERFVPRGGPDGGDGGKGGDIVIRAVSSRTTLLDLKYRQHFRARHGGHGEGSNRTGRDAEDVEILVPTGTVVKDGETGEVLADLVADGQRFIAARGGRGGKGNAHFATSVNRAPRFAQPGERGEERTLLFELKLLADVGIVGLPNVGKSTFLSRVSAARPKIADYPFTTLTPQLGVVTDGTDRSLVFADIPGLIAGAHEGAGMGTRFLRHVERTDLILHLIDISREDGSDPALDYETVRSELRQFSPALADKPQIVAVSKLDLPATRDNLQRAVEAFKKKSIEISAFSAVTGEGLDPLLGKIFSSMDEMRRDRGKTS